MREIRPRTGISKELFSETYADAYYGNIYNLAEGYNAGIAFDVLPRRAINKALNEPWNGDNYSGRIWKHSKEFTEQVEQAVVNGLMTGRSRTKLASELMEYTEHTRYAAERLVRAEAAHFLGEGQRKAYEAAGIEKYRYLAALSERTCEVCAALDNKVFPLDEAAEGVNYPTMHPNCRCVTITADAKLSTRLARDPETGKNYKVDGNMDFQQWKESLSDEKKQAFDLHVRQNKNKSSDKKQYDRYKARLGVDNLPKTFDKFQELKYTDVSKWEELKLAYKDKGLQEKIRRDYNLTVLEGKQGKHIIGHNNYIEGRSYITISVNDVQKLINEYAGTGSIDRDANGVWKNTETVETEKIIGVDVDNRTGQQTETNMFKIHYAKKGVHIVPKRK